MESTASPGGVLWIDRRGHLRVADGAGGVSEVPRWRRKGGERFPSGKRPSVDGNTWLILLNTINLGITMLTVKMNDSHINLGTVIAEFNELMINDNNIV